MCKMTTPPREGFNYYLLKMSPSNLANLSYIQSLTVQVVQVAAKTSWFWVDPEAIIIRVPYKVTVHFGQG